MDGPAPDRAADSSDGNDDPSWLAAHVPGRALGLIAVDRPGAPAADNRAHTAALADALGRGLGVVTMAARPPGPDIGNAGPDDAELTLLLLGPPGDDSGRVRGALRTWGARLGQRVALWRAHDAAAVAMLRLSGAPALEAAVVADLALDPAHLGRYHALLRGRGVEAGEPVVSVCTRLSFLSRQSPVPGYSPRAAPSRARR